MFNTNIQKNDPRLAGEVRRYHTWQTVGEVRRYHTWQTVGQENCATHQWNVARILLALWPDAPHDLVVEALFHDVGELRTGDLPFPVKSENTDLSAICKSIEQSCREEMLIWGVPRTFLMNLPERTMLKVADYLNMWEFGLFEAEKGNKHALAIVDQTAARIGAMLAELSTTEIVKVEAAYDNVVSDERSGVSNDARRYNKKWSIDSVVDAHLGAWH